MDDLIRDTLSQITKTILVGSELTIFLNPKTNKQKIVDCVLFHLRDEREKEYAHSSILLSENYSFGLRSISFRIKKEVNVDKAKEIFFYIHSDKIYGKYFPINK